MAELVALRLSLPARLANQPLDALLSSLTPATHSSSESVDVLPRTDLLRAERGVARLPWVPSTCLYRALGRYAFLRKNGVDAAFVMGLGAKGIAENGHAWVELRGEPFEEPDDVTRYTVTFRYPQARNNGRTVPL